MGQIQGFLDNAGDVTLPLSYAGSSLFFVDSDGIRQVDRLGLEFQLPSAEQIRDRIKSDGWLEAVDAVQALFLVAQCIARATRGAETTTPSHIAVKPIDSI